MGAKGDRMNKLLENAAKCFLEARSPFEHEELVKQSVTLDECGSLSDKIGAIIQGYLNADDATRKRILMAYAVKDSGIPFAMVESQMSMDETLKKLKGLGKRK